MKIRKMILTVCAAALAFALSSCSDTGELRLGSGNTGGLYYTYANMLRELDGGGIEVKQTAGSQANMRLLNEGFVDLAIVQSDVLSEAVNGTGDFEGEPVSGVRAVAGLYSEAFQLIVRSGSDIYALSDLKGKVMSVGEEGSGVAKNAAHLLSSAGVDISEVNTVYMSYTESAEALEKGDIDVFFIIAGSPSTVVSELAESTDIRFISPDATTVRYMLNLYKGYFEAVIPAGTYKGQDADITTVGVKAVLAAEAHADSEKIKALTAELFENSGSIKYSVTVPEPELDYAVTDIPCSFHKGAAEYYEAVGVTVNTDPAKEGTSFIFGSQDN